MKICQLNSTYHHWNIECGDYIIFWSNWSISFKEIKLLSLIRNTAIIMECYIHFLPMFSEKKICILSIFVTFLYCTWHIYNPQYIHPIHNQSKFFSKRQIKAETSNMLFHKQDHSIITDSYVLQGWGATSTATKLISPIAVGPHFLEDWFIPCQELLLVGDIEEVHLQVRHDGGVLPLFVHVTVIADDKFLKKNYQLRSKHCSSEHKKVWWLNNRYTEIWRDVVLVM